MEQGGRFDFDAFDEHLGHVVDDPVEDHHNVGAEDLAAKLDEAVKGEEITELDATERLRAYESGYRMTLKPNQSVGLPRPRHGNRNRRKG